MTLMLWHILRANTINSAPPALATDVLVQAMYRRTLDWPEKMMEVYIRHCENYEDVETLLRALSTVHHTSKGVAKRRAREAAMYSQQPAEQPTEEAEVCSMSLIIWHIVRAV
jgi:hypothetical protein